MHFESFKHYFVPLLRIEKTFSFKGFFCYFDEKTNINFSLQFTDRHWLSCSHTDTQYNYVSHFTYFAEWSLLEDGGQVHHAPVVVGGAAALVQHLVIRRLEQTVSDVIPGASSWSWQNVSPQSWPVHAIGEMFEHDLCVRVAASLLRGEPGLGRLGGGEQRWRHGDLAAYFRF